MEEHVGSMLVLWKDKYKGLYLAPVCRVLDLSAKEADELIRSMLITHDLGKLVRHYQDHLEKGTGLRGYRHEILSAALTSMAFSKRPWRTYLSATVMLHHEPILLGQVRRIGERYASLTHAYKSLSLAASDNGIIRLTEDGVETINKILKEEGFPEAVPSEISIRSCLRELKRTVVLSSLVNDRLLIRIKVATLLHVLVLLDALAAKRREGDQGGTFVSRRAKIAEVGELT